MEDGTIIKDTNVVLEIPAGTSIACGIMELYVKQDGQFGESSRGMPWWKERGRGGRGV